jgi:16S rRNA (uracil1498-N3)-methyltransferase
MPQNRYYLDTSLQKGSIATLNGKEHHHLRSVMKNQINDVVELVNGKNCLARAKIESISKTQTSLAIEEVFFGKKHSSSVILAQAFPKLSHLDWLLEKATELGVDEFWLFASELSEEFSHFSQKEERFKALLIAAMKQSGRLTLPKIVLYKFLKDLPKTKPCFFGDVRQEAPCMLSLQKQIRSSSSVVFFVGPERGFTLEEVILLEKGFSSTGVKLNENILRTETAAICAVSLVSQILSCP